MEKLENSLGDFKLRISHYLNPLHIYCRFREIGIPKKPAIFLCRSYEKNIYNGNGGSRASKLLKTLKFKFK